MIKPAHETMTREAMENARRNTIISRINDWLLHEGTTDFRIVRETPQMEKMSSNEFKYNGKVTIVIEVDHKNLDIDKITCSYGEDKDILENWMMI